MARQNGDKPVVGVSLHQAHALGHTHARLHATKDRVFACERQVVSNACPKEEGSGEVGVVADPPSSQAQGASVMKNCEPLVLGPL